MSGGLILPGQNPTRDLRQLVDTHNRALGTLHPEQQKAINRLLLATMLVRTMVGDTAPAEVQQAAAQEALAEVMRREAAGHALDVVMWRKPVKLSDDNLDQLVARNGGSEFG